MPFSQVAQTNALEIAVGMAFVNRVDFVIATHIMYTRIVLNGYLMLLETPYLFIRLEYR